MDSGYMSMQPGVTAPPASLPLSVAVSESCAKPDDEYMAMTPNSSVSPPQHIHPPVSEGYMVMSPSSSCSPDLHGMAMWGSRGSIESRAGSDYTNMSPISVRSACSTPPSHQEQHPLQPKMACSYFSLPRSYQHTLSTRFEDDLGQCKGKQGGGERDGSRSRGKQGEYWLQLCLVHLGWHQDGDSHHQTIILTSLRKWKISSNSISSVLEIGRAHV